MSTLADLLLSPATPEASDDEGMTLDAMDVDTGAASASSSSSAGAAASSMSAAGKKMTEAITDLPPDKLVHRDFFNGTKLSRCAFVDPLFTRLPRRL